MRIVAGTARGRPLRGPKREGIRPTSDRVRETLFNVLGPWLEGAVLDLYAGTGALALEALSRGASRAVLVDSGREAQQLIARNAADLGFASQVELLAMPVDRALAQLQGRGLAFEWVFADPPYALRAGAGLLERLAGSSVLAPGATLMIESDKREPEPVHPAFEAYDVRAFGDTVVRLFHRSP